MRLCFGRTISRWHLSATFRLPRIFASARDRNWQKAETFGSTTIVTAIQGATDVLSGFERDPLNEWDIVGRSRAPMPAHCAWRILLGMTKDLYACIANRRTGAPWCTGECDILYGANVLCA